MTRIGDMVIGDMVRLTAKAAKGLSTRHKSTRSSDSAWKGDAERVARTGEVVRISRDGKTAHVRWSGRTSNETYALTVLEVINPICYARADRYEPTTIRCAVCNMAWDIDDSKAPSCPRSVRDAPPLAPAQPDRLPFASGLPQRQW